MEASIEEQELLAKIGRKLARGTNRFGEPVPDSESSLIHLQRLSSTTCRIRIVDAVGVIATPSLVLDVEPKIPPTHLTFLLERADLFPRLEGGVAALAPEVTFLELVARWFVQELDRVLEEGLARDYRLTSDEIAAVRGRIDPLRTANLYYRGRTAVVAEFEEFDFDTPLNRLLLHAARLVMSNPSLPGDVRRAARRQRAHMDGVGELLPGDLHAVIERRTSYYRDAALLARQIVNGTGRALVVGDRQVWTFLIRTPQAVEAGLRNALAETLPAELRPVKRSRTLPGSTMTLNPDLVFGHTDAVADVKYKLVQGDWRRADLYEIVAFATGYRTRNAALLEFRPAAGTAAAPVHLPDVHVGDVRVRHLAWAADPTLAAEDALERVARDHISWALTWQHVADATVAPG
jgi:hypothetical protein